MGRAFALAVVLLASALPGKALQAQDSLPVSGVSTSLQAPPCVCPAPPCCSPAAACDREPLFAIQLMLGQVTGVRGQFAVYGDNRETLVVEGFYGELFHNLGDSQALAAGARYLYRFSWPDCVNALHIGPGVDVFFQLNHNELILLTPSLDVAWLSRLSEGIEWEIGLEAGLGIGVAGHTKHGNSGTGEVTPLISFYTGLRF
jgi:hypothetical protein